MRCAALNTPLGVLHLFAEDAALCRIAFPGEAHLPLAAPAPADHPLLCQAKAQLAEYFAGRRQEFRLPLSPSGTPFQQAVWAIMRQIP